MARRGTRRANRRSQGERAIREVDWKLLFNQLFALEIKKEHVLGGPEPGGARTLDRLLHAYTCYSPSGFVDALEAITAADSSEEAHAARRAFYEDPDNRRLISELDHRRCVGDELRRSPAVRAFLDTIWRHKDRAIPTGEVFFDSPEGRSVVDALKLDGADDDQEVALVLVPGYAGHTIKHYLFEEIVLDANLVHGRPLERPLLVEDGIDLEFESHVEFYGRGRGGDGPFDILQPAGKELGNTTGANAETVDRLREWIESLPERYARKKLILLGYSKGAAIVLDLVRRHPELSRRVLGFVTFGGVLQGTHVARAALEQAGSLLRDVPIAEFVERLREEEPSRIGRILSPLFADLDLSWLSVPRIRAVFDVLGYDVGPLERQIDRLLGGREVHELVDGALDLSPLERTRWNLLHLTSRTFREPTYVFNLSAVTDVEDFVRPMGLRAADPEARSLLAPVLDARGTLDWKHLSLDALFLYVTSIEGFKTAPGGLYDTQVELGNTKVPMLDRRPLSETLTPDELAELWRERRLKTRWKRCGVDSVEALARTPRNELFPDSLCGTIDAVDLGEIRGHHWAPLVQALRPPRELSTEHARWDFPRKAFMRALLQTLALRNLAEHAEPESARDAAGKAAEPAPVEGEDDYRDVVFFRSAGIDAAWRQLLNLYNLVARAATYGIVVNSARTGLGTSPPTGRALRTESLYYQALRLYSAADTELRRGLFEDEAVWPLPRSLALVVSRFPGRFASSYPDEPVERLAEVHRALNVLAPGLKPFELRRLAPGDYVEDGATGGVTFSAPIRDNLRRGTWARLREMERDAYDRSGAVGLEDKLKGMLSAFTPLATVFSAAFDPDEPGASSTRLTVYLPPYHTLHAEDLDDPSSWFLEKGLKDYRLPRPVRLNAAELTHVRYLQEADPAKTPAIRLEVHRDFGEPDGVTTVASFGRLYDGPPDDLYLFDASDRRDALHVVFRPGFDLDEAESPADRRVKEAFNRVFGPFEVEAHIHVLTLHGRRKRGAAERAGEAGVLRPRFALTESTISFRVNRQVDSAVEHLPLQAAGFTVRETAAGAHRYHCWRDFGTWETLRDEFFYGRSPGSDRARLPTHLRGRLLDQLLSTATRAVMDRSVETIEDAIDEEIARIADNSLKRYSKARTVLFDRLHAGLF